MLHPFGEAFASLAVSQFVKAQSSKLVSLSLLPYFSFPSQGYEHKKSSEFFRSFVIPLGLEPRTHTLKVYCSTN
ncbi:MAG: hypothetical protein RI983_2001 [Bacteroidota bacterium]